MKDKSDFFEMISPYLEKEIMVPIFASDRLAVLRVADSFYVATDYTKGKNGYISFLVNSKMIRAMMVDEDFLEHLMLSSDRQTLATMMFELSRDTFRKFRKTSKDNPLNALQHSFADRQMETWIFETYGKPVIEIAKSRKKGLLGLFRKE